MLRHHRPSALSRAVCAVIGLALLLAACGNDSAEPTSIAEPVAAATHTATATMEPPTPTATVEPATPTPSPEPEPSATPTRSGPAPTVAMPIRRTPTPVPPAPPSEPTPVPESTVETPPEESGGPEIGALLLESDLSDWEEVEFDFGRGFVADGSYHINVTQPEGSFIMLRSEQTDFADVLVSLDVRMLTASTDSYGCVLARTDYDYQYYYAICISHAAETFALYAYYDSDGEFQVDILFELQSREGTNATTEWNDLSIITYGEEIGFFVNDTFLGLATHSGPLAGSVGFYVENYDPNGVEFEFANLQVWAVHSDSSAIAR